MIRHTVVFKLKDQLTPLEEQNFFLEMNKLASLPGVQNFECLKQISKKNNFDFGNSMEFESPEIYEQYNHNPTHLHFVKQYWMNDVEDFMEIDFQMNTPLKK